MIIVPMPRTILIVDDDPHIRQLLAFALTKAGLDVVEAADGEAALEQLVRHPVNLLILDITMPRMDGLEVCRRVRAQSDTAARDLPILFLSSRDEEIDRVLGIELGADDYVTKPFSPREVVARVQAILRRTTPRAPIIAAEGALSHGALSLDVDGWVARWQGAEVALTATEFGILRTLAAMPSRFFSRDAIIGRLHGPGFAITDRTIDSHVRNLRGKFAKAGCETLIETRPGVGYRLGSCTVADAA
jgi:two-component system, OmpR family, response regulator